MTKLNRILIGLLLAQLAVLAGARLLGGGPAPSKPRKPFADLDPGAVTALRIKSGEQKVIALEKRGPGKWVLASGGGYPALGAKVAEFLGKLPGLSAAPEPVTTKRDHHRTLEVAADAFQRELIIERRGKPALRFYLGSSAGLKDVHLRFGDEDAVYLLKELSAWDAGTTPADWIASEYFKAERDRVVALELTNAVGKIALTRGADGNWTLADLPEGKKLKSSEVDSLLGAATAVTLQEPVGEKLEPRFGLDRPTATLVVVSEEPAAKPDAAKKDAPGAATSQPATGRRTTQRLLLGAKDGEARFAKSDGSRFVVKIAGWTAETFLKKKAGDFEEAEKKDGDKGGDKGGAEPLPGRGAEPPPMPPGMDEP